MIRRARRLLAERSRRGRVASWSLAGVALVGVVVALYLLFPRRDDPALRVGLPVSDPTIVFTEPLIVWPGLRVRVTATRLTRGGEVTVVVRGRELETLTAAPDGGVAALVDLPTDLVPGPTALRLEDAGSGRALEADLDVRPADVPAIVLQPARAKPGDGVAVVGGGLEPSVTAEIRLLADVPGAVLREAGTTAAGTLLATVLVPPELEPGDYAVVAEEPVESVPLAPPATLEVRP